MVLNTKVQSSGRIIGHRAGVIISGLETVVGLLDNLGDTVSSRALALDSGHGPLGRVFRVVVIRKRAGVGFVNVSVGGVNLPVDIAGLLSDLLQQVGTAIPAAEGRQTPVCGERCNNGVMGVESIIGSALKVLGNGATNEEAVHAVGNGVVANFVKGEEHQSVLGEVLILEQGREELGNPFASNCDVGVVGIIGHVRSDEHVLGKAVVLKIIIERSKVLDLAGTDGVIGDGVEQNQWVVLAHVLVRTAEGVAVALVAGMGHILLVLTPSNVLGVEEIGDGGDIGWDLVEVVVVHAKVVTRSGSTVVGLRGMSDSKVVGQQNSLLGQLGQVLIQSGGLIILSWVSTWPTKE